MIIARANARRLLLFASCPLDTPADERTIHLMLTASENPLGASPSSTNKPARKSNYDISKHQHQGVEIAKLLGRSGNRRMDRDALLKRLDRLIRNKQTPVQYLAALSSLYAELNMWKRQPDESQSKISIGEMLATWKREDGNEYAGLVNQVRSDNGTICQPAASVDSANANPAHVESDIRDSQPAGCTSPAPTYRSVGSGPSVGDANTLPLPGPATGGEPPSVRTESEALDPLTRRHGPEKVADVSDSKRVNANQPEDGWVE